MGRHRRDDMGDLINGGSVARWHEWNDKPGTRHVPTFWTGEGAIHTQLGKMFEVSDMEGMFDTVARNGLFVLCNDILDVREFPYANELIGDEHATPYLSRTGNIAALRLATKRRSGFLVPTSTWKWFDEPSRVLLDNLSLLFKVFGFQSTTPASLSEKVLRATLPSPLNISRPSVMVRRDILNNHEGGRIDKAVKGFWKEVFEYDKNKAYLYHSRCVPTPFIAPFIRLSPTLDSAMDYPCGFWDCTLIAHSVLLHPIQVEGLAPVEGQIIDKWLWSGELKDCLEAGYTLVEIKRGYGWTEMSNFMEAWSDLLWTKYEQARNEDPHLLDCIKCMMVGLPGRFLRKPEIYTLISVQEAVPGEDIPLCMNWHEPEDRHFSDYAIRPIYDKESTALSPVGSYIVAEMRRELYHVMRSELLHGNPPIRSYIDCVSFPKPTHPGSGIHIGMGMGEWKEKTLKNMYAEENRFRAVEVDPYGWEEDVMVAPGMEGKKGEGFISERRLLFEKDYQRVVKEYALS